MRERAPVDRDLAGIASPALLGRSLWCTGDTWGAAGGRTPLGRGAWGLAGTPARPGAAAAAAWCRYLFFIPSLALLGCHRREVPLQPPSQAEILVLITN